MPLMIAIPIITGLAALFVGSQIENKIDNPTQPITGAQQTTPPWYISVALLVVLAVAGILIVKGLLKKAKLA